MKLINKDWKLFNKIHILDILVLLLMIFVLVGMVNKLTGDRVASIVSGTEVIPMTLTLESYPMKEIMLTNLAPGDKLGENKRFLDGEVLSVDIVDYKESLIDNNGQMVYDVNPVDKVAIVKLRLNADFKDPIYSFGQQEIRVGSSFFITSQKANISAVITDIEKVGE